MDFKEARLLWIKGKKIYTVIKNKRYYFTCTFCGYALLDTMDNNVDLLELPLPVVNKSKWYVSE